MIEGCLKTVLYLAQAGPGPQAATAAPPVVAAVRSLLPPPAGTGGAPAGSIDGGGGADDNSASAGGVSSLGCVCSSPDLLDRVLEVLAELAGGSEQVRFSLAFIHSTSHSFGKLFLFLFPMYFVASLYFLPAL